MSDSENLKEIVFSAIKIVLAPTIVNINDQSPLIGGERLLDSMQLVELCIALEDIAVQNNFEFDWTSETAMSRSRSMFRTAGALAEEFIRQKDLQP